MYRGLSAGTNLEADKTCLKITAGPTWPVLQCWMVQGVSCCCHGNQYPLSSRMSCILLWWMINIVGDEYIKHCVNHRQSVNQLIPSNMGKIFLQKCELCRSRPWLLYTGNSSSLDVQWSPIWSQCSTNLDYTQLTWWSHWME